MEQLRQVVCSCTTTTTSTALSSAKRRRHVTSLFGTFAQLCCLLISPPGCTKRGSRWAYNLRRLICTQRWLGSRVVSVLDSFAEAPGFKSQPRRCRVIAKFHYTDPTGPARTQRSFAAKKSVRVRAGPVGSVSGPCPCPCSGI